MKKLLLTSLVLLFLLPFNANSQESAILKEKYIDLNSLPKPDCSGKTSIWHDYNKNNVKLIVIPDSPSEQVEFNRMLSVLKEGYADSLIRRESELSPEDFNNGLKIFGNIRDFKSWEKFDLPINITGKGYEFNNHKYENDMDGMFYFSERRMVYTGNSMKIISELQTQTALYKYILFEDGLLSAYCLPDGTIIDIDEVRNSNFSGKSSKYFNLFVDRNFDLATTISDSVVTGICERLQIPLPDYTINAFLHDGANSTRLFSNFFFMAGCDDLEKDQVINTVHMNGIHVNGLDLRTIEHETLHWIWNTSIGAPGNQSFLNEGIVEYYMQLIDNTRIELNIEVLKRHPDNKLGTLIVRGNGNDFWGGPSENNRPIAYNISGLFVKYLIDTWGLDAFKTFYPMIDRELAYKEVYGLTAAGIEEGFNNWIGKL